jgi:hypothetical protein
VSKFNRTKAKPAPRSPVATAAQPTGRTYEGAPGYQRDPRSELFVLAVANMVGEDTFYERANGRDNRFTALVRRVAITDPAWLLGFLGWLRGEANMRSASVVAAAEAVSARLGAGTDSTMEVRNRQLVDIVLQRADEPGELLAYWTSRYGRAVPKPVKRGLVDAVRRLYTEYALLKYDTDARGYRFADVIDLVHPAPTAPWQGDLFCYALDRRHGHAEEAPATLPMVAEQARLRSDAVGDPAVLLDPQRLRAAGMTWEDALSLAGTRVDKARLWETLIPSMGYMALLRNLRNFDEAGVGDGVAQQVCARLADPAQVRASRQFPYRFLAAYEQAPNLRWGPAVDRALNASLGNVPALSGRTLVLIDTSASMTNQRMSGKSSMTAARVAAVFGVVLAARSGADLHGFADGVFRHTVTRGGSVIADVDAFCKRTGEVGHGTRMVESIRATYRGHDRVFLISDMQAFASPMGDVTGSVPAHVPVYGVNLAGYRQAVMPTGSANRHELAGLTDAAFRMIPLLEAGRSQSWPWLNQTS